MLLVNRIGRTLGCFTRLASFKAPVVGAQAEVPEKKLKYKHRLRAEKEAASHARYLEKEEKKRQQELYYSNLRKEAAQARVEARLIHQKYYTFPRPGTPASYFIKAQTMLKDESVSIAEAEKMAAKAWKGLSDDERAVYEKYAALQKVEWERNMARIPRLPITGFTAYVKESAEEFEDAALKSATMKKLAERWRKMPDLEREWYKADPAEMERALEARRAFEAERRAELGEVDEVEGATAEVEDAIDEAGATVEATAEAVAKVKVREEPPAEPK